MPTEEENIQYLYLVLTSDGPPQINWSPICAELGLKKGAVSKRWSRLKQAVESERPAGAGAYMLLWLLVKHSAGDKALDWKVIAEKCGTTPGAASKRYSRMKQAFEKENDKEGPTTPKKTTSATTPVSTLKRKRAPTNSAKKTPSKAPDKFKPEPTSDDDEEYTPKKRVRATPMKAKAKKATKSTPIKPDPDASPSPLQPRPIDLPIPSYSDPPFSPTHPSSFTPQQVSFHDFTASSDIQLPQFQGFDNDQYLNPRVEHAGEAFYESNEYPESTTGGVAAEDRVNEWLEDI